MLSPSISAFTIQITVESIHICLYYSNQCWVHPYLSLLFKSMLLSPSISVFTIQINVESIHICIYYSNQCWVPPYSSLLFKSMFLVTYFKDFRRYLFVTLERISICTLSRKSVWTPPWETEIPILCQKPRKLTNSQLILLLLPKLLRRFRSQLT